MLIKLLSLNFIYFNITKDWSNSKNKFSITIDKILKLNINKTKMMTRYLQFFENKI